MEIAELRDRLVGLEGDMLDVQNSYSMNETIQPARIHEIEMEE